MEKEVPAFMGPLINSWLAAMSPIYPISVLPILPRVPAIGCNWCLDLEYFESHLCSPRINQRFLSFLSW